MVTEWKEVIYCGECCRECKIEQEPRYLTEKTAIKEGFRKAKVQYCPYCGEKVERD